MQDYSEQMCRNGPGFVFGAVTTPIQAVTGLSWSLGGFALTLARVVFSTLALRRPKPNWRSLTAHAPRELRA